jgi:hypothetical protein
MARGVIGDLIRTMPATKLAVEFTRMAELLLEPRLPPTLAVGFTASAEISPPRLLPTSRRPVYRLGRDTPLVRHQPRRSVYFSAPSTHHQPLVPRLTSPPPFTTDLSPFGLPFR